MQILSLNKTERLIQVISEAHSIMTPCGLLSFGSLCGISSIDGECNLFCISIPLHLPLKLRSGVIRQLCSLFRDQLDDFDQEVDARIKDVHM